MEDRLWNNSRQELIEVTSKEPAGVGPENGAGIFPPLNDVPTEVRFWIGGFF